MILLESKGVNVCGEATTRADLVAAEVIIVAELRTMLVYVKDSIITDGVSFRHDTAVTIVFSSTVLDCTPFCWRWDILTKMVCTYGAAAIVHDVRTRLARFGMDLVKQVLTVMGVHLAVACRAFNLTVNARCCAHF